MKRFYNEDSSAGMEVRMVPKLKYKHLHISSFSAMRDDLMAQVQVPAVLSFAILLQVLSESVSHALHLTGGDEASNWWRRGI